MENNFFTKNKSTPLPMSTHHVLRVQTAEQIGLDPYFYFNQVIVNNYYHINNLHNNFSKKGEEYLNHFLQLLNKEFVRLASKYDLEYDLSDVIAINRYYIFCTTKRWNMDYFNENKDMIIKGYEKLYNLSKKNRSD